MSGWWLPPGFLRGSPGELCAETPGRGLAHSGCPVVAADEHRSNQLGEVVGDERMMAVDPQHCPSPKVCAGWWRSLRRGPPLATHGPAMETETLIVGAGP